jgi:FAD/FMN-containing dehydrogenase
VPRGQLFDVVLAVTHGIPDDDPVDVARRRVADAGGRVYLAKDARLDPGVLAAMYPDLERADQIRSVLDPSNVFRSDLARRLRIGAAAREEVVR